MIDEKNFKNVLKLMDYSIEGDKYIKKFNHYNCNMEVDFSKKRLIYPLCIEGRERNCGFDQKENFVVFECVTRLLDKGYRPEHIVLEKSWTLGHLSKGGRADICVYDENKENMLFIIECKTFGDEYNKALKQLLYDGGQLFSYWHEEPSSKWIALYSSNLEKNEIIYNCKVINCLDDENIKILAKKDNSIKLYEKSKEKEKKFEVWKETYSSKMYDNLIFANDTIAYKIGIKPIYKKNLKDFKPEDKIVNKFEEILRHNNVSDKENAFNRLIALFICKLVDEIKHQDDEIVDFQYKIGTDTYETLQDRLQKLHKEGMKDFMKEEIFYVENDYAEKLFSQFIGQQRKNAIIELKKTISMLKFYSNNDFSFIDVHNENLFLKNGKILVEMVSLFQEYRIVYSSKNQFLGDLFESLLNKGFKQNEGQFFTPMPITRFIWNSIPVEKVFDRNNANVFPKIIDYACGAGHFLTEGIDYINFFTKNKFNVEFGNSWIEKSIYGVEKDYRLARVSQVSMFMNGAGNSNIIFGDGLENYKEKNITPNSFNILVANPPYSISGFKNHLNLKNNNFSLLKSISQDGSEIETLFVERAIQLLKPSGIAAIILPSSILTKSGNSFVNTRKLLLSNFLIRSIACFGGKTFGATSTSTVILFLEKFDDSPSRKSLVDDSVDNIISNSKLDNNVEDSLILDEFLKQVDLDKKTFIDFIDEEKDIEYWRDKKLFGEYYNDFITSNEYTKKIQQPKFKKMSIEEQKNNIKKMFYSNIKELIKEKILIFGLVYNQKTLIINSPSDSTEEKKFLGYERSNRRGSEGISIIKPGGELYNDENRNDVNTLSGLIRNSFYNEYCDIESKKHLYHYSELKNMIDFSRSKFNLSINTNIKENIKFKDSTKVELLGDIIIECPKSSIQVNQASNKQDGKYPFYTSGESIFSYDDFIVDGKNVFFATGGKANVKFYDGKASYSTDTWAIKSSNELKINTKFLFYYLENFKSIINDNYFKGQGLKHLQKDDIKKNMKVPVLSIEKQNIIINKCDEVENKYFNNCKKIEKLLKEIDNLYVSTKANEIEKVVLSEKDFTIMIGKRVVSKDLTEKGIPVYSANVNEILGYVKNDLLQDYSVPSIVWGIDGNWNTNYFESNYKFYPTDHCGIIRINDKKINPLYFLYKFHELGENQKFDRNNRASVDRIKSLNTNIPSKKVQDDFANQVNKIREKINILINENNSFSNEKKQIFDEILK